MKTILLTGGPCSGKTVILEKLNQYFKGKTNVVTVGESITEIKRMGIHWDWINDTLCFQKIISGYQVMRERLLQSNLEDKDGYIIYDRGALDGLAYFDNDEDIEYIIKECQINDSHYDIVFILQSAYTAKDVPQVYLQERNEDKSKIQQLEKKIRNIYEKNCSNTFWVRGTVNIETKVHNIIDIIENNTTLQFYK